MGEWSSGVLENWNDGIMGKAGISSNPAIWEFIFPILQYSNTPIF
jgi:hypothetical protein